MRTMTQFKKSLYFPTPFVKVETKKVAKKKFVDVERKITLHVETSKNGAVSKVEAVEPMEVRTENGKTHIVYSVIKDALPNAFTSEIYGKQAVDLKTEWSESVQYLIEWYLAGNYNK